jgi:hypothetical protein
MKLKLLLPLACLSVSAWSQTPDTLKKQPEKNALKFNINESGSHYFQAIFMNQTWIRYSEMNPGTLRFGQPVANTFDIGLRRTRIQLYGQVSDRAFIYFQFGQNNFNNAYNAASNRKIAAFFHDAVCEYKVTPGNGLKIGAGLTVLNGVSRFSQPSVGSIMTLDVPVFLQYSVDQVDQFDRRLSVYARGQAGKLDYRIYLADPFPVNSNGSTAPPPGKNATFVNTALSGAGIYKQFGGYFAYNFLGNEPHTTPYMQGTYLGKKKIWNIAVGAVYQPKATWHLSESSSGSFIDTTYNNMVHLGFESYFDVPVNKERRSAFNAFAGYYITDYGKNYLRYNGIMNPATASSATKLVQSSAYGNSFPMFGSGNVTYFQAGYLLAENLLGGGHGQLMPYLSAQVARYDALGNLTSAVFDAGVNGLLNGHQSKISVDFQSRPTFSKETLSGNIINGPRRNAVTLQYQVSF